MQQILQHHEALFRFAACVTILLLLLQWQTSKPRRPPISHHNRTLHNLMLAAINSILVRYLLPITAVAAAEISINHGWGLFNLYTIGFWPSFFLCILLMDLIIYGQHVLMHKIPLLWRLHRVHHTDLAFDVTTGLRFHSLEIMLSALLKSFCIILLGPPIIAVIIFEMILNISSMFNHSNIYIPPPIDRVLRYFIITPDMHRVHHSSIPAETNSNYGFNLPWWDHIFSTYQAQPATGHTNMDIGLKEFKGHKVIMLHWLLLQPFFAVKDSASTGNDKK